MPEPDGSSSCSEEIAKLYFKSDNAKAVKLMGCNSLLDRRQELTALIDKIKLEMQDAAYATTEQYRVSWVSSDTTRLDAKRLKAEQPAIYTQYSKTTSSRRFTVTRAA